MSTARVPPNNLEAERCILGAILLAEAVPVAMVDMIRPDYFYREHHRAIYEAALHLWQRKTPIEILTLAAELDRRGKLEEVGGRSYLLEVSGTVTTDAFIAYHAAIVREHAIRREVIRIATEAEARAYEGEDEPATIIYQATASLREAETQLENDASKPVTLRQLFSPKGENITAEWLQELSAPMTTNFESIDRVIGGWRPGNTYIIAGGTGSGKTALATTFALATAAHGKHVYIASLEMTRDELGQRLACARGRVDILNVMRHRMDPSETGRLLQASAAIQALPITIDDRPDNTPARLRAALLSHKQVSPLDLVIVDYLQLIRPDRKHDNREQEVASISRDLKAIAKELNVPVIALSQLNEEGRTRESRAIENDASAVLTLIREAAHSPMVGNQDQAKLKVSKARFGPAGSEIPLRFLGQYTVFEEIDY